VTYTRVYVCVWCMTHVASNRAASFLMGAVAIVQVCGLCRCARVSNFVLGIFSNFERHHTSFNFVRHCFRLRCIVMCLWRVTVLRRHVCECGSSIDHASKCKSDFCV
jgi:hypothetical protein